MASFNRKKREKKSKTYGYNDIHIASNFLDIVKWIKKQARRAAMKIVAAFGRMKVLNRFPEETYIWKVSLFKTPPLCSDVDLCVSMLWHNAFCIAHKD